MSTIVGSSGAVVWRLQNALESSARIRMVKYTGHVLPKLVGWMPSAVLVEAGLLVIFRFFSKQHCNLSSHE